MKKSPSRRVYLPRDFIECLRTHVAGFSAEPEPNQWGLAVMLWESRLKRRQHRTRSDAMTFTAAELEGLFGRGKYVELVARVPLFARSSNWSQEHKLTRAYWPTAQGTSVLALYRSLPIGDPVDVLQMRGSRMEVVKTLPLAISSISTAGTTTPTEQWAFAKHTLNRVPINTTALQALQDLLSTWESDPSFDASLKSFIPPYADVVGKLLRMANTTLAGPGYVAQTYPIAPSGRLYARGLSLQNIPSVIKEAALAGLWEYDFANCHFTIVAQMAQRFDVACPAIEHYMANKEAIRQEIADGAGITIDQAKQCLLALLYGARTTKWLKGAIPSVIGQEKAETLYALPQFKAVNDEVYRARRAIIAGWTRTASGALTNACGRAIAGKTSDSQKLSHLVQGVEAEALRTIVSRHPDDIVVLQHDGFASRRQLDCRVLESAVLDAVGYRLQLEEQRLELDADARSLADRTKDEIAREAAPVLDLDGGLAD